MPHKTMDDQARAAYEEQCLQLRAELKSWEGNWAATHGGSKPGRADIKQNPDIGKWCRVPGGLLRLHVLSC
jgi:DNA replication regulator SLD2